MKSKKIVCSNSKSLQRNNSPGVSMSDHPGLPPLSEPADIRVARSESLELFP